MSGLLEKAIAIVLTGSAVVIAATLAHREFADARSNESRVASDVPVPVNGWEDAIQVGHSTGQPNSSVRVVEFGDLECPFCGESYRRFHSDTSAIAQRYDRRISYTFVHFPLGMHRFARPAARAAECAAVDGKFFEFVSSVFATQDSLGLKPWIAYAREAGVRDEDRFVRCVAESSPLALVDSGVAVGKRLGVSSTPTVIINGWKFTGAMADSVFTRTVDSLLLGRDPAWGR